MKTPKAWESEREPPLSSWLLLVSRGWTDWQAGGAAGRVRHSVPAPEEVASGFLLPQCSMKEAVRAYLPNRSRLKARGKPPPALPTPSPTPRRPSLQLAAGATRACLRAAGCPRGCGRSAAVLALLTAIRPSEALTLVLSPATSCFHLHGFQNRYQRP